MTSFSFYWASNNNDTYKRQSWAVSAVQRGSCPPPLHVLWPSPPLLSIISRLVSKRKSNDLQTFESHSTEDALHSFSTGNIPAERLWLNYHAVVQKAGMFTYLQIYNISQQLWGTVAECGRVISAAASETIVNRFGATRPARNKPIKLLTRIYSDQQSLSSLKVR